MRVEGVGYMVWGLRGRLSELWDGAPVLDDDHGAVVEPQDVVGH